jgi:hypothetical protein
MVPGHEDSRPRHVIFRYSACPRRSREQARHAAGLAHARRRNDGDVAQKQIGRPGNGLLMSLGQAMDHWSFGIEIFNFPNGQWVSGGCPVVSGRAAAGAVGQA